MEVLSGIIILGIVVALAMITSNNSNNHVDKELEPTVCPKCDSEEIERLTGSAKENWRCYRCNHAWV